MPDPIPSPSGLPKETKQELLLAGQLITQIGLMIALPAVLLGFGGAYLDKYLGSSPLFVIIGLLLALSGSAYSVYKLVKRTIPPDAPSPGAQPPPTRPKTAEEDERSSFL